VRLRNGMSIRERLVAISPEGHFYKYSVIESPLPIREHESVVQFTPVGKSQTKVTWTAQFEVIEGDPKGFADGVKAGVLGSAGFLLREEPPFSGGRARSKTSEQPPLDGHAAHAMVGIG